MALRRLAADQAALIAERLRAAVESAQPGGLRVTESFGVTASGDPTRAHEAADGALYASKRGAKRGVRARGSGREPVAFLRPPPAV